MKRPLLFALAALLSATFALAAYQMENLSRGIVAVRKSTTEVYVGWRLFGTDPAGIAFNLYRSANGAAAVKLNATPLATTTDYVDTTANFTVSNAYHVKPVIGGVEQAASATFTLPANAPVQQFLSVPLQIPAGGTVPAGGTNPGGAYTYDANDASVADLDGDGELEIILKWNPTNAQDNANDGYTGNVYIDAYKLNGTRMWRIDLGKNIRAGAHYTQFQVYDYNGDGKAELICKTADGTVDGVGTVIGSATADWRNSTGRVLAGPEFITVFNGQTGAAMYTTNYVIPRGNVADWGDTYGNRVDRFLAGTAYLDGVHPSAIFCRGYYTRTVVVAFDWNGTALTQRWRFDTRTDAAPATPAAGMASYEGMGNHQLSIADVDGNGTQEIIYGSIVINADGTPRYTTTLGHGDALHVSKMNPDIAGLQVVINHESPSAYGLNAFEMHDASTGTILWGVESPALADIGRGNAFDVDPTHRGYESWAAGDTGGIKDVNGIEINPAKPSSTNFAVWWDADHLRELEDANYINKWNWVTNVSDRILTATECSGNNGTKNTPCLSGDILGDWREEVIWRTTDNTALHIYTTTIPATDRIYTLLHNPMYRVALAWQNTAYNQPPHPDYYLGDGMTMPPAPNITLVGGTPPPAPAAPAGLTATAASSSQINLSWTASSGATGYNVKRATVTGGPYTTIATGVAATTFNDTGLAASTTYFYVVSATNAGGESANSTQASATTQAAPPPPPAAPTGLGATAASSSQINLSWTASTGATGYNVKRATVTGGPYTTVATGVAATTFNDTGLAASTTYFYVVSATNAGGESANSTQASATTQAPPPPPAPAAPTGLTATAVSSSQINLSWTASTGATGYNVKRATVSGGPYTTIATGVTTTTFNDTGLAASTTYYYVVSATNTGGESANSVQASATTQAPPAVPPAPTGLTAAAKKQAGRIGLTWNASTGATSYNVKRATVSGGPYTTIATGVTTVTYTNTGLTSGTTYYYVVSAVNGSGESANSAVASATSN